MKVKLLNNTEEEGNRFLKEIDNLKEEIKQLKKENIEYVKALNEYKNLSRIEPQKRNARGAGRKPKFSKEDIIGMEIMKENGSTYQQIADEYNTSKVTVIKYLKKKK